MANELIPNCEWSGNSQLRKGDTITIAGVYRPFNASERAINGWRTRRHRRKLPRVLREYTIGAPVTMKLKRPAKG